MPVNPFDFEFDRPPFDNIEDELLRVIIGRHLDSKKSPLNREFFVQSDRILQIRLRELLLGTRKGKEYLEEMSLVEVNEAEKRNVLEWERDYSSQEKDYFRGVELVYNLKEISQLRNKFPRPEKTEEYINNSSKEIYEFLQNLQENYGCFKFMDLDFKLGPYSYAGGVRRLAKHAWDVQNEFPFDKGSL